MRFRKMLSLDRPRHIGGGYREVSGERQEEITESFLDQFFDKKDEGSIKTGYPILPRLNASTITLGQCPCGGDLVILQDDPDNVGCGVCGRRQLRVYDPKNDNHMDDLSKMTLGNEVANKTPTLPGVPQGTTNYPRQNPGP